MNLPPAAAREVAAPSKVLRLGMRSPDVGRAQEWLCLSGGLIKIDDDFGAATQRALLAFQRGRGLAATGEVDLATWKALVSSMVAAFSFEAPGTYAERVAAIAHHHLRFHPVEVGGQNRGPWVRAYTGGFQGVSYPWCAGFVSSVLKQASGTNRVVPLPWTLSVDNLAEAAKKASRFVSAATAATTTANLEPCSIFLVRGARAGDWVHTGFSFGFRSGSFRTVEGNTSDDGSREGYEVCARTRTTKSYDFIRLT